MDKQRILNISIAAVAIVNGLGLLSVWLVVMVIGTIMPAAAAGWIEAIVFVLAAGGLAFGLRRLARRVVFPRWLGDRPLDRRLISEFQPFRTLILVTWWAGLILGMFGLVFILEIIREGSGLAFVAAVAMLGQEKMLLEYYILKTES